MDLGVSKNYILGPTSGFMTTPNISQMQLPSLYAKMPSSSDVQKGFKMENLGSIFNGVGASFNNLKNADSWLDVVGGVAGVVGSILGGIF